MAGDHTIAAPGSYQQYKSDTVAFLTWLQNAAKSCSWKLPKPAGSEATIELDNSVLPVREIVTQARAVCASAGASPVIHLPRSIARLAQRAIDTRTRFCEAFESLTSGDALQYQNRSHRHFTNVLQEALDMLLEHASEQPSPQKTQIPREIPLPTRDTLEMTNAFAGLEIGVPAEIDQHIQEDGIQNLSKADDVLPSKANASAPISLVSEAADVCIKIMCFFEDLNQLYYQVMALWEDFDAGARDMEPVAMATNAAIALAGQMETDLLTDLFPIEKPVEKSISTYAGVKSPYAAIIGLLMSSVVGVSDDMPTIWPELLFGEQGPAFFCDMALTLSKVSRAMIERKKQKRTLKDACALIGTNKPLFSFFPMVETLEVTLLLYCVDTSFIDGPNFGGFNLQDRYLTAVLLEYCVRHESLVYNKFPQRTYWIDQAMVAFAKLDEGKVGAAAILSCLILFKFVFCRKKKANEVQKSLHTHAEKIWSFVNFQGPEWDTGKPNPLPTWTVADIVHNKALDYLQRIVSDYKSQWADTQARGLQVLEIDCARLTSKDLRWKQCLSLLPISKQESTERMDRLVGLENGHMLVPTIEPGRIWAANPLACGTTMYKMSLACEQSGICLLNSHLTVITTIYLYTALKTKGLIRGSWPEMENLIATHLDSLFFGAVPSDLKQLERVWNIRTRAARNITRSWLSLQGGDRTGKMAVKLTGPRCFSISDTAHLFSQCFDGKADMIRTVHLVNELRMTAQSSGGQKSKMTKQLNFDDPKFLSDYADFIAEDCKRFELKYVQLQRTCNAFMLAFTQGELVKLADDSRTYLGDMPMLNDTLCNNDMARMSVHGENGYPLLDSLLVQSRMQDMVDTGWAANIFKKVMGKEDADALREWVKCIKTMEAVGNFVQKYLEEHGFLVKLDVPFQASVEEVIDEETTSEHVGEQDFMCWNW